MEAKITRTFRIAEGDGTRKYTPGTVAKGPAAEWAVANGYGEEIGAKAAAAPQNKAAKAPKNKGA